MELLWRLLSLAGTLVLIVALALLARLCFTL